MILKQETSTMSHMMSEEGSSGNRKAQKNSILKIAMVKQDRVAWEKQGRDTTNREPLSPKADSGTV